jgi:hypothetical protein
VLLTRKRDHILDWTMEGSSSVDGLVDDLAYILLEGCEVALLAPTESEIAIGEWLDIDLLLDNQGTRSTDFRGEKEPLMSCCELCHLVIYKETSACPKVFLDRVPFFDGEILSRSRCACGKKARSDASLLLGVLRMCNPIVVTNTCKVFFWDESRRRVSLVFTLGFPSLTKKGRVGSRSILLDGDKDTRILHPSVQAVLSILRSDWNFLQTFMNGIIQMFKRKRLTYEPSPSFFPYKLTLEEIFDRLNGSHVMQELQSISCARLDRTKQPGDCHILKVSNDTLAVHLAPFLTSVSLNSLRCTCSHIHKALRAVVPGLKLRLYRHQIKSLCWMRTREASSLSEADLIKLSPSSPHAIDGDAHRSATCGWTVSLAPRSPDSSAFPNEVRINQVTGREVEITGLGPLNRMVARGGLLCDDPGLGKTITVLSLLLQTAGVTPSVVVDTPNNANGNDEDDDDSLFQVYWREHFVIHDLRREPLLKLFNSFLRSQRVGNVLLFSHVRKAIESDAYGGEFSAFERDVEYVFCTFVVTSISIYHILIPCFFPISGSAFRSFQGTYPLSVRIRRPSER